MLRLAAAALITVLALPAVLRADNNAYSFTGEFTAPACGSYTFTVGAATKTIDVVASTDVPANDIVLKLARGGSVIAAQDSATSPEAIHYAMPSGGDVETGAYTALVCPFNGEAVSENSRPKIRGSRGNVNPG